MPFQWFKKIRTMKKLLFVFSVLAVLLTACKKDKTDYVTDAYSYYPMKTGNYWVYQWFEVDSNGNETLSAWQNDSVVVLGDTTINGNTFYKVELNVYGSAARYITYMRDSAMWMVDQTGSVVFSVEAQAGYFNNDYSIAGYDQVSRMDYGGHQKLTPAGVFQTIFKITDFTKQSGLFCNGTNKRSIYTGFARGIGPAFYNTFYLSDPLCRYFEARLLRYHLN